MMMTLAPGIPAPEGSDTLPEILPKTPCPKSVGGKAAKTTNTKTTDKESGRARKARFMAHSNGFTPHADAAILTPFLRCCQSGELLALPQHFGRCREYVLRTPVSR